MFDSQLDVEINVIFLANSNVLYFWFYLVNSSEEESLVVVFGVLDDASGEIDPVNHAVLAFEGSELKGVDFLHDIQSEIDELIVGKGGLMVEERIGHPFDCGEIFLLVGCELS